MMTTFRNHWLEYAIEAACLGLFMMSAGLFGALLGAPELPLHQVVTSPFLCRALKGLAMAAMAVAICYSPWASSPGPTSTRRRP
jgi:aquaporin Z